MAKKIQLTNRNPDAIWKKYNRETGKIETVNMADMDDDHLQKVLIICQKRKTEFFLEFLHCSEQEAQLKQEAKNRNATLDDLDDCKATHLAAKFSELEELMIKVYQSSIKKIKQVKEELTKLMMK